MFPYQTARTFSASLRLTRTSLFCLSVCRTERQAGAASLRHLLHHCCLPKQTARGRCSSVGLAAAVSRLEISHVLRFTSQSRDELHNAGLSGERAEHKSHPRVNVNLADETRWESFLRTTISLAGLGHFDFRTATTAAAPPLSSSPAATGSKLGEYLWLSLKFNWPILSQGHVDN